MTDAVIYDTVRSPRGKGRPDGALHELTSAALSGGEPLDELEVRRPTLEDVYLELVGQELEEAK